MPPSLTPPPLPPSILRVRYPDLLHQPQQHSMIRYRYETYLGGVAISSNGWGVLVARRRHGGSQGTATDLSSALSCSQFTPFLQADCRLIPPLLMQLRTSYRLGRPPARSGDVEDFSNADSFPE